MAHITDGGSDSAPEQDDPQESAIRNLMDAALALAAVKLEGLAVEETPFDMCRRELGFAARGMTPFWVCDGHEHLRGSSLEPPEGKCPLCGGNFVRHSGRNEDGQFHQRVRVAGFSPSSPKMPVHTKMAIGTPAKRQLDEVLANLANAFEED